MTAQTSIEQHLASSDALEERRESLDTTTGVTQHDGQRAEHLAEAHKTRDQKRPNRIVAYFTNPANTNTIVTGAAILAMSGLFVAGVMNRRIRQTLENLADSATHVDVPITLPISIVASVRELIADRRAIAERSAQSGKPHEATQARSSRTRRAR